MKRLATILLALLTTASTCSRPAPVIPPAPPPIPVIGVGFTVTPPVAGVHFTVNGIGCDTLPDGIAYCQPVPTVPAETSVDVAVPDGYLPHDPLAVTLTPGQNLEVVVALARPFPPAPSREQVLNVRLTFQGLTCTLPDRGILPVFEAMTAWLSPADRQALYACKHAAGDTHSIVAIPSGRPLYDEPNQPYDAAHFPALDWTNGNTSMVPAFRALVEEQIREGFTPQIFLDEQQASSYAELPIVIDALQHGDDGIDLTPYVVILPGWDGVFYGWEPSRELIPGWAAIGRAKCPACHLAIEFQTGHIPLGEGGGDYAAGGAMTGFDALYIEFGGIHDNNTWGVLERLIGPAYNRPADDQPPNDGGDPHPRPWYLARPTPRGPWGVVCFEFGDDEYRWVRYGVGLVEVQGHRAYLQAAGCRAIG